MTQDSHNINIQKSLNYNINTTYVHSFFNWRAVLILTWKEIYRFLTIWKITIIGPMLNSILFLCVFYLALPNKNLHFGDVSFTTFVAMGLISMTIIQNAFFNTSNSILMAKINQNLNDIFMSPLSSFETILSYTLGGIGRGIMIGLLLLVLAFIFLPMHLQLVPLLVSVYYMIFGSLTLSAVGLFTGLWAKSWDRLAVISNFVIQPLTFLSGTFYPIHRLLSHLPPAFHVIIYLDPFFYMIDGFRYGFTGYSSMNPTFIVIGIIYTFVLCILSFAGVYWMYEKVFRKNF